MTKLCCRAVLAAVALATLFAATPGAFAQEKAAAPIPDVLIFTNGDKLTGKLVRGLNGNVTFKSDMAGEITVSIDKIKELHVGGNFAVLRKDIPVNKQPIVPGSLVVDAGKLTVTSHTDAGETMPVKDAAYIIDEKTYARDIARKTKFTQGWNGSLTGGATLVRSSQNGSTFTAAIALIRVAPVVDFLPKRNRTTIDFVETYGKLTQEEPPPVTEVKTSILHADAERDEYFSPRAYALAVVDFDHNYSQGLDLQQVYGGGFGWTPIQKPNQQLDLKVDVHYEKQQFETTGPQNIIGSTISEAYHRTLPHKFVITESANILPAYNIPNDYSANGSIIFALPVFKRLSMTVTTTDSFLNDPAPGYQKNSYQFVTGISYTLH